MPVFIAGMFYFAGFAAWVLLARSLTCSGAMASKAVFSALPMACALFHLCAVGVGRFFVIDFLQYHGLYRRIWRNAFF